MKPNKIVYDGEIKIDLTEDTITPEALLEGITAHNSAGEQITGNVKVQTFRTGNEKPSDEIGKNGDLFLVVSD